MSVTGNVEPTSGGLYERRKLAGVCTYGSKTPCPHRPEDGAQLCPGHLRRERKRKRLSMRRTRQGRRDAGECAEGCGSKSETYRCAACAVRLGRIPSAVAPDDNKPTADRIWRLGTTESDATTLRYRGRAQRGRPTASSTDDVDLRYAGIALDRARKAFDFAGGAEVKALPRIQREAVKREAVAYVAHAVRFLDDLLDRHKIAR